MPEATLKPSRAERLSQKRREFQQRNAKLAETTEVVPASRLSRTAEAMQQALPADLIQSGEIEYDPKGQPRVAFFHPRLIAPDPQRGRLVDHDLDRLAASLDRDGQQDPLIARLVTETDRRRFPDHFIKDQRLRIMDGGRIYFAQQRCQNLPKLRVELILPYERESDADYIRRCFVRTGLKLMHSQEYTIFDKVNLYQHWTEEFSLASPSDAEAAKHFQISKPQATRLRVISQLDESVAQEMINGEKLPADEVIYEIANRPALEHKNAYKQYGTLTVSGLRNILKSEKSSRPDSRVTGKGRPKNFTFALKDESSPFTFISTARTPNEWNEKGGAKAFLSEITKLIMRHDVREQLKKELG